MISRPVTADAGRPAPPVLAVSLEAALPDGGTAVFPLSADAAPTLPPTSALSIRTNLELSDARIRLVDESNRLVPSDETLDVADGGTVDRIALKKPLAPSSHYLVLIDAETGASLRDSAGEALPDQRLAFATSDAPQADPKKPARRRRHPRHHRRRAHHPR